MTIEEAKVVAVLGARAEVGKVVEALGLFFDRAHELERERISAMTASEANGWRKRGMVMGLQDFAGELRARSPFRFCIEANLADLRATMIEREMMDEAIKKQEVSA